MDRPSEPAAKTGAQTRWLLFVLLLVALILRITFALEMADTPLPRFYQWMETDMAFFNEWAENIAAGDLLSTSSPHPLHGWHIMVARQYLKANSIPPRPDAARELWNEWYGGPRFHQEPAYPYLLGTVYAAGGSPTWVFALQGLLGLVSLGLLFLLTQRLIDTPTALIAVALGTLCGPLLFYEHVLLRGPLLMASSLLALYLTICALDSPRLRTWWLAGAALGLAFLVKSTMFLFLIAFGVGAVVTRGRTNAMWQRIGLMLAGFLLPLVPAAARNFLTGAPLLQFSSVGPITFINSNAPDFNPGTGSFVSQYAGQLMASCHDSLWATVWNTLSLHESPFSYMAMALRKSLLFWHPTEIPNNLSYHYFERFSVVLGWMQLSTFWLLLPAVGGVALALGRWRKTWPLVVFLVCGLIPMAAFYNLSRFRTPLLPFFLPFTALAILTVVRDLRHRSFKSALVVGGLALTTVGAALLAAPEEVPAIRTADYVVCNQQWESLAKTAFDAGEPATALRILERALTAWPENESVAPVVVRSFGKLHLLSSAYAREMGDDSRAQRHMVSSRRLMSSALERENP